MRRYLALAGSLLALCALAGAQESTGSRVVVPARNSSHPREVHVTVMHASVTVKTYNGKEVIVESQPAKGTRAPERNAEGLRRIDIPERGLEVEEEDNVVHVRASNAHQEPIVITVPPDTSLHLKGLNGAITADGVHGEVEAATTNGQITLTNISGTVVASSNNGAVKVTMNRVDPGKPISFSTLNGDIDVSLPADVKANVKVRSMHGPVYSDFEIKPGSNQPAASGGGAEGRFKAEFGNTVTGTINGGGAEASFNTMHGRISIRKKQI